MYKLIVEDRCYNNTSVISSVTLQDVDIKLNPLMHKLFTNDTFNLIESKIKMEHSPTRSMESIPAVLILEGNKMYGKRKSKFLYKCIPSDRGLPVFLVPYKIKPGFVKNLTNKYIVFKFSSWNDKHPIGTIIQTIGDVSALSNIYEYQLHCKNLYITIKDFSNQTRIKIRQKSEKEHIDDIINSNKVKDRRNSHRIISVDPEDSKDFDDAFSIIENEENYIFSIYISNVSFWLDNFDLWDSFATRISTIYLPDRKLSMLPKILSDSLCSLQEGRDRFALTLDLTIDKKNHDIINTRIINSVINVEHNLRYDTKKQENDPIYKKCLQVITTLNTKYNYIDSIKNSHDFIAYIMILMNYICAKEMKKKHIGIFRSAKYNSTFKAPDVNPEIKKFLKMWNSGGGTYLKYKNMESHDILGLDAYIHITSPIRRLVDLLNIIQLQDSLGLFRFNPKSRKFYDRWSNDIEYINTTMKSIRKVQKDCSLLKLCTHDKSMREKQYDAFIFDKIVRKDSSNQYSVFIKEIGMVNRVISRNELTNFTTHKCTMHLFMDEINLKKKVKIQFK